MTGAPHLPTDGGFKSHGFGRQDEVVASPRLAPLATTVPGRPWRRSKTASRGRSPGRYREGPPRTAPLPKVTFKGSDPLKEAWISALDPGFWNGKLGCFWDVHEGSRCWVGEVASGAEAFGGQDISCFLATWVIDRTTVGFIVDLLNIWSTMESKDSINQ